MPHFTGSGPAGDLCVVIKYAKVISSPLSRPGAAGARPHPGPTDSAGAPTRKPAPRLRLCLSFSICRAGATAAGGTGWESMARVSAGSPRPNGGDSGVLRPPFRCQLGGRPAWVSSSPSPFPSSVSPTCGSQGWEWGSPLANARALKIGEHVEPWSKVPRAAARIELPTLVGNSMLPQVPGKAVTPFFALSQLKPQDSTHLAAP